MVDTMVVMWAVQMAAWKVERMEFHLVEHWAASMVVRWGHPKVVRMVDSMAAGLVAETVVHWAASMVAN
jgi:hypothetical protein